MTAAKSTQGRIAVFARAPVPGKCKTRLIPALGAEGAAGLAAQLLARTLVVIAPRPAELWCTPDCEHPLFARLRRNGLRCRAQSGRDLGHRMLHAFSHMLQRAPWAVIVGTDCPELEAADLDRAGAALEAEADAVLGPAHDGGYYLLGLRRPRPELFVHMPWGQPQLLTRTRATMAGLAMRWEELPVRHDLDRPTDLEYHASCLQAMMGGTYAELD